MLAAAVHGLLLDGTRPFHLDLDAMMVAGASARVGMLHRAYSYRWIAAVEALMGYPPDQAMLFTYPPTGALFFAPLSLLSASAAYLACQALGLVLSVPVLLWIAPRRSRLPFLFASLPIACLNFRYGQNGHLLASLTALSAEFWVRERLWMIVTTPAMTAATVPTGR